ncbi:HAMP domain-containing protein, partial [Candidatus Binatia bacterium]|nr:HAMP domain-containing protein [Candidatus Binatia bacterium]
ATLLATRSVLLDGAFAQLQTVRAAVGADLARFTRGVADDAQRIAADPRLTSFLKDVRDAQKRAGVARKGNDDAPAPRAPRWLAATAEHEGWTDVLVFDEGASRVVYASGATPQLVTGGLAAVVQRNESRNETGSVTFVDGGADPAFDGQAMLYVATSVVDGGTRLGTLVIAIAAPQLDAALRAASGQTLPVGLGDAGSVWLIDASHRVRAALGAPLAASDGQVPGDVPTAAVDEALQGREGAGSFSSDAGGVLAAFAPIEVGEQRWAIGVQMPRAVAMAPLSRATLNVAGAVLLAAILGWFLGARLWSQFSGRLRELATVLARAQRGDRQARLEVKQDGPVAELAGVINRLLDERATALARSEQEGQRSTRDAESLLGVVRAATSGDLTPRAQVADGSLGNVSRAMNEMLDGIGALVTSMRDVSSRVGSSASEVKGCTEQAASTASSQARECGTLAQTAQALRAGNQQIAEQCAVAVDAGRRSEQASKQGQTALSDLITGMDGLQRETRAATVKIKRLGERSMQISAITGTISKMSAQTDMLALNAAIEASRAGEHGQGFTVVAEEVRKLAERAAAATKEVERLIAGIQSDVNEAVGGMERQAERLDVQTAAASQAGHALERVSTVTGETTVLLEQIAGTATQQLERATEIDVALKRISDAAKGVQQSSEQARRTTAQILSASEELGARASQFQA